MSESNSYSPDERESFMDAVQPIIKWVCDHCNPHTTVIVTHTGAELLEGAIAMVTHEHLHY